MVDVPAHATPPPAGLTRLPRRAAAVVTCMDCRIDPLAVLDLTVGDAIVLRNAGARVTDDVLRSLALAVGVLGVTEVLVMQHTNCGLTGTTNAELQAVTGADLDFGVIGSHDETLSADLARLVATPYLAAITRVVGLLYDTDTGGVSQIV